MTEDRLPPERRGDKSWAKRHMDGTVTWWDTKQRKWVRTDVIPEDQLMTFDPVERCRIREHRRKHEAR